MNTKLAVATLALCLASLACKRDPVPTGSADQSGSLVERGKHLVMTSACHDCHTPLKMGSKGPEPDFSRTLSGHPAGVALPAPPVLPAGPWVALISETNTAWAGPWGISYTRNLTPDRKTGLGTWTRQMFIDTIRNGRHMGVGRPLLPPMPAAMYAHMSDEDLGAIFAYLQSLPAIENEVPDPLPPKHAALAPPAAGAAGL